jgi:hypothetical protein
MKLLAISLARVTAFTDFFEWDPRHRVSMRDFTQAFVERYGFLKFPQTFEEFDLEKGVTFQLGKMGTINVDSVTLFTRGVVVDSRSSTDDDERFLVDAAAWVEQLCGVEHSPERLSRMLFLSELSFTSEAFFDLIHPAFKTVASRVAEIVSHHAHEPHRFEPAGITFFSEPPARLGALSFRIERLAGSPYSENKYFSSAPLPTEEHLSLLEMFEVTLQRS